MQDLPHRYTVSAQANAGSDVELTSPGLAMIESAPPAEYGGPGDKWSPETLLAAAVADCFILSFKAIARASKVEWTSLSCDVEAVLDRVDRITRFTEFRVHAALHVPQGVEESKATRLLEMAERNCLVTNSLSAETHLKTEVHTG